VTLACSCCGGNKAGPALPAYDQTHTCMLVFHPASQSQACIRAEILLTFVDIEGPPIDIALPIRGPDEVALPLCCACRIDCCLIRELTCCCSRLAVSTGRDPLLPGVAAPLPDAKLWRSKPPGAREGGRAESGCTPPNPRVGPLCRSWLEAPAGGGEVRPLGPAVLLPAWYIIPAPCGEVPMTAAFADAAMVPDPLDRWAGMEIECGRLNIAKPPVTLSDLGVTLWMPGLLGAMKEPHPAPAPPAIGLAPRPVAVILLALLPGMPEFPARYAPAASDWSETWGPDRRGAETRPPTATGGGCSPNCRSDPEAPDPSGMSPEVPLGRKGSWPDREGPDAAGGTLPVGAGTIATPGGRFEKRVVKPAPPRDPETMLTPGTDWRGLAMPVCGAGVGAAAGC
jgi:hypothetical protein